MMLSPTTFASDTVTEGRSLRVGHSMCMFDHEMITDDLLWSNSCVSSDTNINRN